MSNNKVEKFLEEADKIIVGLSGGADSVALTHILFMRYGGKKLVAAHVNHGIRGKEAARDEAFVKEFCTGLSIELKIIKLSIPQLAAEKGLGLEECGRDERYKFFSSLCTEKSVIATAHNMDDNAETLVLNLCRGTGIKGIGAIPPVRKNVVRPILAMSRTEIEAYCKENKLEFIIDSTNSENDYARNKVRNKIFPQLKEINLRAVQNIAGGAVLAREAGEFIENAAQGLLAKARCRGGLNATVLLEQGDFLAKQALCLYLVEVGAGYEKRHIEALCLYLKKGGGLSLPKEFTAAVKQNTLTVTAKDQAKFRKIPLENEKEYEIFGKKVKLSAKKVNSNTKINNLLFKSTLDCAKIKSVLAAEPRKEGESFKQAGRGVTKSLKKLFNEAKIPAALRDKLIIIRDGDQIAFIEGFGAGENYAVDTSTQNYLSIEITLGVSNAKHDEGY